MLSLYEFSTFTFYEFYFYLVEAQEPHFLIFFDRKQLLKFLDLMLVRRPS